MLVSYIVPVYNAESTLRRCIESLIHQNFTDWELLLVDDGSEDSSGTICDEYALCDDRIVVIHKENEGVSIARNIAIDKAKGDYLLFVDSDDYILGDISSLVEYLPSDMLVFNSISFNADGSKKDWYNLKEGYIEGFAAINGFIVDYINTFVLDGPCAKLIKREAASSLRFPERQKLGEDNVFMLSFIKKCKKISCVPTCYYVIEEHNNNEFRYRMSSEEALSHLSTIISTYKILDLRVESFEQRMFETFFIVQDPTTSTKIWFSNDLVKEMEKKYLHFTNKDFKERYYLMKYPIYAKIKKALRSIKKIF